MWLHWIIDQPRVIFPSPFFYSNWEISPSSLVESCSLWKNKPFNWGYNLFFSLRQRKTVNGLLHRVDTCLRSKRLRKRIYKNNKEKKLKWIIIFVYLVYCCDFAFTTVLEQVDQEQKRGMKWEEFFLFSFFFSFFYFVLSLSLSLSIFRTKPRSETLTTQA